MLFANSVGIRNSMDRLRRIPVVRDSLRTRFERAFPTARGVGCLCGEFDSFADARASCPPGVATGYDVPDAPGLYADRRDRILPKDYPALFWLLRTMTDAPRIFDIGGHVGLHYYAYSRYLAVRHDQQWQVCDVPVVARAGAALAAVRSAGNLSFTTSLTDASGADIVLAAGSLQYIENPLPLLLESLTHPPRVVIVNETPTHLHREFITLQNIGVAVCPYRIMRFGAFVAAMESAGYTLLDSWEDQTRRTQIAYVTEEQDIAYSGFAFQRAEH